MKLLALLVAAAATLNAAPPWNVDDPGTTPTGQWAIYAASIYTTHANTYLHTFPSLAATFGLTARTEAAFGLAGLAASNGNIIIGYGVGDVALGLKHRFWEGTQCQAALVASATLPTGARRITSGHLDRTLYVTGAMQVGDWTLTANLGTQTPGRATARTVAMAGLLVERNLGNGWSAGIQCYGNGPQEPGSHGERAWGVGLTKDLSRRWQFQAQVGRSLRANADLNLFLGITASLGGRA